jgi:phosphatidate cytidylyltransferase
MLAQRVMTARVILALLVPALLAQAAWPFILLTLIFIGAAGWEWGRLNQAGMALSVAFGLALVAAGAAAFAAGMAQPTGTPIWWLAVAVWSLGGWLALRAGPSAWPAIARPARWVLGLGLLWASWLAISQGRGIGINFILSVFCVVWAADIAAYFGGRALGKRKLAPTISPGKSWEGVFSGMLGVLLLALAWMLLEGRFDVDGASLFAWLQQRLGWAGMALALAVLVGMSVVGDLLESLVKRAAGAKDSSRLLPGHGGVLDRVDALLPVFPLALALISL